MFHALPRLPFLLTTLGLSSLLTACGTSDFTQKYFSFDDPISAPRSASCQNVKQMVADDLHGDWSLELTQLRVQGDMRLSRHPEFSDSLRGHIQYGPVKAIASGDVKDGNFDLDESSDGKRLTATWSGSLPAGDCGRTIRGTWTELDTQLKSSFVLRRISPVAPVGAKPAAAAPLATPTAPAAATQPAAKPSPAAPSMAEQDNSGLPIGVQVMPVPDPGFN